MAGALTQARRADAGRNRERILDAARATFTADGLDVPMRAIAARAGVGPATLYRHFPSKQDLATAAFEDEARACQAIVERGLADPDAWRGLRGVLEDLCALHTENHGFTVAFTATYPGVVDVALGREESLRKLAELLRRAQTEGGLRADVALSDLVLLLAAHRGIGGRTPEARAAASRRYATLAIQALAAA